MAAFYGPIISSACNCPGTAPSYGCVLDTIERLVNLGVTIGIIAATLALVYAGFTWMTASGNPEARSKGRSMLINVFVGLFILLTAWLVVDFIMKRLYNSDAYGPWNSILAGQPDDQCIVARNGVQPIGGLIGNTLTREIVGTGSQLGPSGGSTSGSPSSSTAGGSSKLNVSAATSFADQNAAGGSTGACALYVRKALAAGGLTSFDTNHPQYAYQYGPYLTKAGFTQVSASGYSPQKGDVIVFQPVTGHTAGHIEIYDGSHWVSDFVQQSMYPSQDYPNQHGSYAIYRG